MARNQLEDQRHGQQQGQQERHQHRGIEQMIAKQTSTRSTPTPSLDNRISMSGKNSYSGDVKLKITRNTKTSGVFRHNEIFGE